MRSTILISCLLAAALALPVHAKEPLETPDQIRACVIKNTPDASHIQAVQMRVRDRLGSERVLRAQVYGRRDTEGFRRVLVRFTEPPELLGSAFLFVERADVNELVVRSPDMNGVKVITGRELLQSVAGSDFTYEDFERMRSLAQPGVAKLLDPREVGGRPAYVLETRPAQPENSAYERVVHFVDQDTCLLLRQELYEAGSKLRKVLTATPERFRELGSVWVCDEFVLRDLQDETETRLIVESFDMDADLPATTFTVKGLEPPATASD